MIKKETTKEIKAYIDSKLYADLKDFIKDWNNGELGKYNKATISKIVQIALNSFLGFRKKWDKEREE